MILVTANTTTTTTTNIVTATRDQCKQLLRARWNLKVCPEFSID